MTAVLDRPKTTTAATETLNGAIYCPCCTRTVSGSVRKTARGVRVVPGQKCSRCSSSLDAGYVMRVERAA